MLVGPFLLLERLPPLAALVAAVDRWRLGAWFVDQDWLLQRYRFRASGVGALADVGLALAFAAAIGLRGRRARLLVAAGRPSFSCVLLVVADNRGSMLAGALTLGLMATVWRRRLLPLVPLVACWPWLLVVAFGPSDRGLSLKTLAQRFWFWENSLYLAREVPLTGAGLGLESVQLVYRAYFLPSYPPFSHAHNIYLQGLLEYGIFGLLGLVGLGLATLWVGWRAPEPCGPLDDGRPAGRLRRGAGDADDRPDRDRDALDARRGAGAGRRSGCWPRRATPQAGSGQGAASDAPTHVREGRGVATPTLGTWLARPWRPSRVALVVGAGVAVLLGRAGRGGRGRVPGRARRCSNVGTAELNRGRALRVD